ncbi:MAG: ribosomal protein S18-alanine N-acetyltransferase [Thermodesulforhabdaceae bacterium]|jgi:ribosomal-protein-alanine N-acetyltransferase
MEKDTSQELMNCSNQSKTTELDFYRLDYNHIEEILEIEQKVQYEPWTAEMFAEEANNPASYSWVACMNKNIIGYVCSRIIHDLMEILNIAVHPEHQGCGIGSMMFSWVIQKAVLEKGIRCIHLEVRASNEPALKLYLSHGFKVVGERRSYYLTPSGREKALLMEWCKE